MDKINHQNYLLSFVVVEYSSFCYTTYSFYIDHRLQKGHW